ncbi:MAG: metallophosphoesterase [Defluviitaleaceae bacterium]|nr:metallophosphoesterase [Defluviitaleaceae bacterium]
MQLLTNRIRKTAAFFTAFVMVFGLVTALFGSQVNAEAADERTRIDLLTFSDLHGHVDSLMNDVDPGAARLVAYLEWMRLQNPNPDNVMIIPGGDDFHGHPLSNHLMGSPVVAMMNYLGVEYLALGNHEFSFGNVPHFMDELDGIFLAADLFYASGHPRAGQRPDFVQPYAVVEFEGGDVTVGLIGFMTRGMEHLVTGAFMNDFELRTPTLANADPKWISDIDDLIEKMKTEYGVDAIVAVTHMYTNAANHATAPGGEAGQLAEMFDFDAIIAGHSHRNDDFVLHDTLIIEAGAHGRVVGRISLYFDEDGNLDEVTAWRSPLPPAFNAANIANDAYTNTASVRDFIRPAGTTFDGLSFSASAHPDFETVRHHYEEFFAVMQGYAVEAEPYLGRDLGARGVYSQTRDDRNVWVTGLVLDYVLRSEDTVGGWDVPHWTSDQPGWVYISNFGGWRNVGPFVFTPDTPVTMRQMYSTMPFSNTILLYEMYGKDLLVLLNMQSSANVSLDPPIFGLNGGQPPVVAGAFNKGEQIGNQTLKIGVSGNNDDGYTEFPLLQWYMAETGLPIANDETVYRVIGSNFTQGAAAALLPGANPPGGGDRFPIPGTTHANALGMTFLGMPMALMQDGTLVPYNEIPTDSSLWEVDGLRTLRSAMIAQQLWRSEGEAPAVTTEDAAEAVTLPALLPLDEIARQVINGFWGNGAERVRRLTDAGYDARAVQNRVNQILR